MSERSACMNIRGILPRWKALAKRVRALSPILLTGCKAADMAKASQTDLPEDTVALISKELSYLAEKGTVKTVLTTVAALLLAAMAVLLVSRMLRRFRRRYRINTNEFNAFRLTLSVVFIGVATVMLFHFLIAKMPLVATAGVAAAAAGTAFVAFRYLPAWMVGFGLVVRGSVRAGDLIQTGDAGGVVERIGVFRMVITDADGARVHLGLADLGKAPVTVSSPTKEHLVEYIHHRFGESEEAVISTLRTIAVLSPYRTAESHVRIDVPTERQDEIRIRFHTWSEDARDQALRHLKRVINTIDPS